MKDNKKVIKRCVLYKWRAKHDIGLQGKSSKTYQFKEGQVYSAIVFYLNLAVIGIDSTKVTINASWLYSHFELVEECMDDNQETTK